MNLNGDEKKIRQLFRELSCEDEVRTPAFESVLSSTRAPRPRNWSLALAGGLAMLVLAVVVTLLTLARTSKPVSAPDELAGAAPPPVQELAPPPGAVEKPATPKRETAKHRRPRRTTDQLTIAIKTLSAWQSPTASLMKYPGEDLLKSLPRLGESLETIKSLSTDQFN